MARFSPTSGTSVPIFVGLFALVLALAACAASTPQTRLTAPSEALSKAPVSRPLCSLVGPHSDDQGVYGTDLGFPVAVSEDPASPLLMLFGDTWSEAGDSCRYPEHDSDDLLANLPARLPANLPMGVEQGGAIPACNVLSYPIENRENVTSWRRMRLFEPKALRGEGQPAALSMGMLRTPVSAFRARSGTYGVFFRNEAAACQASADCPTHMVCSADMERRPVGQCTVPPGIPEGGVRMFCRDDEDCLWGSCEKTGPAMCLSQSPFWLKDNASVVAPAWYREDPRKGVAQNIYIARMVDNSPGDFLVEHRFATNRFVNVAARAIAHFDPAHPEKNDYRPGSHTLLMFGRPAFVGTGGAQSLPFLLYQRLPEEADAPLQWAPRFFAGYGPEGKPRWSDDEEAAQPVYGGEADLRSGPSGTLAHFRRPEFDNVNQMSVTYLPSLDRWVMLYGGDVPEFLSAGDEEDAARKHPQPVPGAVHMRSARHPFGALHKDDRGAWSEAVPVLTPQVAAPILVCPEDDAEAEAMPGCLAESDPEDKGSLLGTLVKFAGELSPGAFFEYYAKCAAGEFAMAFQTALAGDTVGRLYGASVIEPWTQVRAGEDEVDLYWAVSTWNPYEVFLVKTTLSATNLP